jgi:thiamine-phosphate diphosphorylase
MTTISFTHEQIPGVVFHQPDGVWKIRVQSSWVHADVVPTRPMAYSDTRVRDELAGLVLKWRSAGYVVEDALVLGVFEQTCQQSGAADFSGEGKLNAKYFPRLVDVRAANNLDIGAESVNAVQNSAQSSGIASLDHRQGNYPAMQDARPGVYPIVDRLDHFESLLDAGARIIQLRIKSETLTPEIRSTVAKAAQIARAYPQSQFFLNDYWQLAIELGVYGVHLGQEDLLTADLAAIQGAGLRLGVSSHAFWEVARAMTISPSYIACGPVFPTRAKAMPWIAQGLDNLRYWSRLIPFPVIGIGGVNADNLASIHATGCASASIIQAIVSSENPAAAYQKLQSQWIGFERDGRVGVEAQSVTLARPTLE